MSRQVLRAFSLVLVFALGVTVVPFAIARSGSGGATAKAAQSTQKVLKNIKRSCRTSKSSKRLRSRTRKRLSSTTYRYTYRYCSGRTLIREITRRRGKTITKTNTLTIVGAPTPGPARTVTTPGPTTTTPGPTTTVEVPAKPKPFRLTLLQNNDGESKNLVGNSVPNYGGVARFKTVLDRLRGEADAFTDAALQAGTKRKGTVVISSGDNTLPGLNLTASFQKFDRDGSPFYDSLAFSRINYDAASIGNHEYDFGPGRFAQFVQGDTSGTPFLSVNADYSGEPALKRLADVGRLKKSTVVVKGGERIGIIGVTPPDTPNISKPGNVTFATNVAELVNAEASRLTADGVDKLVFASHLQNSANERAVTAQLRNVDIVIAGGGDDLLAGPDDPLVPTNGEPRQAKPTTAAPTPPSTRPTPVGPYPTLIPDADGRQVPLVTTTGEYRYVGRLTAEFDENGRIASIDDPRSGPVRVSALSQPLPETGTRQAAPADPDAAAEDPALKAEVVDPLVAFQAGLAANIIGTTEVLLDGGNPDPIRLRESGLGDLVADGFRYVTNKTATADGRPVAQVAFSNGGGIRTSIPQGNVSEKQTFDVLPFDNVLVTVPSVPRAQFKELMEHGFASLPDANGRFPQISGFSVTVTRAGTAQVVSSSGAVTTPGTRVQSITLDDPDGGGPLTATPIVAAGAVVPGDPVNIATTNFTAGGGDGYPFRGAPTVAAGVAYQQALFQFIKDPDTTVVGDLAGRGGVVRAADYPQFGEGRITLNP